MTVNRGILVACLIGGGFVFFLMVSKIGQCLLEKIEARIEAEEVKSVQPISMIPKLYPESCTSHL